MKFISFYTGHYTWDAEQLKKSFDKLGIKNYEIEYKDRIGNWARNTQMKAPFILEKLKENDAVVWTDADSRIRQIPTLFDTIQTDIAVFYLPTEISRFDMPEYSILQGRSELLQSGTMYFKNNPKVIKTLERWIELNEQDPNQWDQWTLQVAIEENQLTNTPLPPEYVWMDIVVTEVYSTRPPVIEHTQASRRLRKNID